MTSRSLARFLSTVALTLTLAVPALWASSDRGDDVSRVQRASQVFQEIASVPDRGIPSALLDRAQCIGIIPGQKKFALGIGGQYGKGLVSCRTASGWSAPLFITVGGGSWGLQLGGSSTDVVMVFMNRNGVTSLLSNKFRIGADANAAAGPVGRAAAADTDVALHAQILTYSRSRGAFAGVSLNGSVVQPDDSGNQAMYGSSARPEDVLNGKVPVPSSAQTLVTTLSKYTSHGTAQYSTTPASSNPTSSPQSSTSSQTPSNTAAQPGTTNAPDNREQSNQAPNTTAPSNSTQQETGPTAQPTTPPASSDETQPRSPQPSGQQPPSTSQPSTGNPPPAV